MKNYKSLLLIVLGLLFIAFTSCDFSSKDSNRGPIVLGDPSTIVTETNSKYLEDTIQDLEMLDSEIDLQPTEPVADAKIEQQVNLVDQQTDTTPQKEEVKQESKPKETSDKKSKTSTPETHKVQNGESFYNIALKYGMSEAALLKINNLTKKEARRLKPGQIIKLK
ncbi:MAG TPA: LysM peptidoglycan-binding domain-containing protein [Edaphocola sp.]|nr:LysM peptidoglycan-binding domain-containing protein [Edaphocola sp.]